MNSKPKIKNIIRFLKCPYCAKKKTLKVEKDVENHSDFQYIKLKCKKCGARFSCGKIKLLNFK